MTVFYLLLLAYFVVVSGIVYDIIVEPPSIGSTEDRVTGAVRPVVFLPGRVNGQYIIEGLWSGFMFVLDGIGIVLMDLALDRNRAKSVRVSFASAGISSVVGIIAYAVERWHGYTFPTAILTIYCEIKMLTSLGIAILFISASRTSKSCSSCQFVAWPSIYYSLQHFAMPSGLTNPLNPVPLWVRIKGQNVEEVLVIRIYGSTLAGQKACLHVHRIFDQTFKASLDTTLFCCGDIRFRHQILGNISWCDFAFTQKLPDSFKERV